MCAYNKVANNAVVFRRVRSVVFQVPSKDLEDHALRMTVVDTGRSKRRAVIGHLTFPLSRLAEASAPAVYKMDLDKVRECAHCIWLSGAWRLAQGGVGEGACQAVPMVLTPARRSQGKGRRGDAPAVPPAVPTTPLRL